MHTSTNAVRASGLWRGNQSWGMQQAAHRQARTELLEDIQVTAKAATRRRGNTGAALEFRS